MRTEQWALRQIRTLNPRGEHDGLVVFHTEKQRMPAPLILHNPHVATIQKSFPVAHRTSNQLPRQQQQQQQAV